MEDEETPAYCGLVCSKCPAYIATQTGDDELRRQTAERWSSAKHEIHPDDILCDGCKRSERLSGFCDICEVRSCARQLGLAHCGLCGEYVCDRLDRLWRIIRSPEAKEMLESLRT